MNRRAQITMSDAQAGVFLAEERTVICATVGRDGAPHLMPLWYVLRDLEADGRVEVWSWTYARSQKTRNLERDPRATLLVEAGELYHELRGLMLECDVVIHRDSETVAALGLEIFARYANQPGEPPVSELPLEVAQMVSAQAPKRVALQFKERRRVSWDHGKLGAVY